MLLEVQIATTSHDVDSAKHSEKAPIVAITNRKNPDLPLCALVGENLHIKMAYVVQLRSAGVSSLLDRAKMDGTGVTVPFQSGCEGIGVGGEPGEGLENGTVNESEAQAEPALQGDCSGG